MQQQKRPLFLHLRVLQTPKMLHSDPLQLVQAPKMLHSDLLQALQTPKNTPCKLSRILKQPKKPAYQDLAPQNRQKNLMVA